MIGQQNSLQYVDPLERRVILTKEGDRLDAIRMSLFNEAFITHDSTVHVGILGDVHGHLTLALEHLQRWQEFSGWPLDSILQVGDIGAMSEQTELDKPTKEMAVKDSDELGFLNYFHQTDEADRFLGDDGYFRNSPLYFIDGNHDDVGFLNKSYRHASNSVGHYDNMRYMPSGSTMELRDGTVVGSLGWHHDNSQLRRMRDIQPDVLVSHKPPKTEDYQFGDEGIASLQRNLDCYHFFGHAKNAKSLTDVEGKSYGLNEVSQGKGGVAPGSTGVFLKNRGDSLFIYLPSSFED